MSVLFSRQCEYALQAVLYIALLSDGSSVSIKTLTERLHIPYHFLGKTLQDLTRKGLLVSKKGPAGGFGLARSARDITLLEIVEAIDGTDLRERCVLGFPDCGDSHPCSVHQTWGSVREQIRSMLASRNIADLARDMRKQGYQGGWNS